MQHWYIFQSVKLQVSFNVGCSVLTVMNQWLCVGYEYIKNRMLCSRILDGPEWSESQMSTICVMFAFCIVGCYGISSQLNKRVYCSFHSDCLGLTCCLDLSFFIYRHSLSAYVRYEPCLGSVVIGVGQWSIVIEIQEGTSEFKSCIVIEIYWDVLFGIIITALPCCIYILTRELHS